MLKKIPVDDLRVGMHLHELCGSWMEHPFWRTKFVIRDPKDLRRIVDSGIQEVWIDVAKGFDVAAGAMREEVDDAVDQALLATAIRVEAPKQVSFAEEVQRATKICAKSKQAVVFMFQEVRMGKAISADAASALVEDISSSVQRNPGALISLARLKTADDYTYMHSVAVCALMVSVARQLGLNESETREAGMAGLLHDLGKALIPAKVLNKPGRLTDAEFDIMKTHPEAGHRILLEGGTVGDIPLDVCLHHHEKIDGSGYPHRLKDKQISQFAKIGAVCDVYDAITSNRPYKAGWDPAESIRRMAEWCKGHFDETIFQAFVKSIGIYPVGSLVRLKSDRLAVVLEQSPESLLTPRVKAFFSTRALTYIQPEIIDLARPSCPETIASREDAAKWDIRNVDDYWISAT